jgi:hypothetical protein
MSAVKEARQRTQRLERRMRSAAMNKCPCGNVAGLNSTHCGRCRDEQAAEDAAKLKRMDIVFQEVPGTPDLLFVEVEDGDGKSVKVGEWVKREDGFWALRIER